MERVKSNSNGKGIDKVTPVHALKAGWGNTATAPLILELYTGLR
jgi:hypothetical protein